MIRKFQLPVLFTLCLLVVLTTFVSQARTQTQSTTATTVPRLVRYAGVARDLDGKPLSGVVGITFSLYAEQTGDASLWVETQNVQADASGHYAVLLGSTKPDGLPAELFASEQARWIGVQVEQQAEQPRTLLVSAPYALKAGDAETLGGLPPSAFLQVSPTTSTRARQSPSKAAAAPDIPAGQALSNKTSNVTTTGGAANKIAMFTTATNIQNSMITQKNSKVGVGTSAPAFTLQVEGSNSTATGVQSATTNTSTATNSFAVVSATSQGVIAEMVADGLGSGPLRTASGFVGTATDQPLGFITDNIERMRITRSGLVGIGTIAPTARFQVNSQAFNFAGILANGFTAATGSGQDGSDGLDSIGGNGDLTDNNGSVGGIGVLGYGGQGAGNPGSDGIGGVFQGGDFVGNSGDGVDAYAGSGLAGYFQGDVDITGTLSASTKDFKVDDPLDPANKYLVHASVESSEMINIYSGNVVLDEIGYATVRLPTWFQAVNGDCRYQLTAIGRPSPGLYIAQEISDGRFEIAGGSPGTKVSWQVTGTRQDAYAKAHPLIVEQEKEVRVKGFYIHPELYGAPVDKQIEWARQPQVMRKMRQLRKQTSEKSPRLVTSANR